MQCITSAVVTQRTRIQWKSGGKGVASPCTPKHPQLEAARPVRITGKDRTYSLQHPASLCWTICCPGTSPASLPWLLVPHSRCFGSGASSFHPPGDSASPLVCLALPCGQVVFVSLPLPLSVFISFLPV